MASGEEHLLHYVIAVVTLAPDGTLEDYTVVQPDRDFVGVTEIGEQLQISPAARQSGQQAPRLSAAAGQDQGWIVLAEVCGRAVLRAAAPPGRAVPRRAEASEGPVVSWTIGFMIVSPRRLTAHRLALSTALAGYVAAVMQVSECCVRLAIKVEGHSERAVYRGVEALWTLLEQEQITAFIEAAWLGTDTDCTALVRELEAAREAVQQVEFVG